MTPERFRRLDFLYDVVVGMDPEARARYLEEECAGDDEMRRELAAAFDEDSHSILTDAVEQAACSMANETGTVTGATMASDTSGDSAAGEFCGPYQLIRLLAQGGMGAVYLGQRRDGEVDLRV